MSDHLESNLAALRVRDPDLAERIAASPALAGATLAAARSGEPTLSVDGHLLHNRHDPAAEARQWAGGASARLDGETAETAVVLGFALGYHLDALARRWTGRLVAIEPDLAMLRTAFASRDLRALLARVELAPGPLADEVVDGWSRATILPHAPSLLRPGAPLRAIEERIAGRCAARTLRLSILVVSPFGGGSYPITGYCARALQALGHDVHVLDLAPFAAGADALPAFGRSVGARRAVHEAFTGFVSTGVRAVVEQVQPDIVLAMAQAPLDVRLLEQLGDLGCVRAFWFVEDHRLLPYWKDVAPGYDYFGVIQQGAFLEEAAARCAGRALYLPLAADPLVHQPLVLTEEERAEFGSAVGFVGAGYRNRRIAFRPLLDQGLKIWGSDWSKSGHLLSVLQRDGARISTEDSVRIFNATTVNLNLHSSTYVDGVEPRGDFVNPRTFELAACGAFQLVDRRALLPALFAEGTEVVTFDDAAQLPDLVRRWLADPDARERVTAAARVRVLGEHTYGHRMLTLLETICAREHERFARRSRAATAADIARLEGDSSLGQMLSRMPPTTPFTLDGLVGALQGHEGDLEDPEALMLFLHQFDELYVKEHRA